MGTIGTQGRVRAAAPAWSASASVVAHAAGAGARRGARVVSLLPVVPRQAPLIAITLGASSAVSVTVGVARIDVSDTLQTDPRWLAKLVAELQGSPS